MAVCARAGLARLSGAVKGDASLSAAAAELELELLLGWEEHLEKMVLKLQEADKRARLAAFGSARDRTLLNGCPMPSLSVEVGSSSSSSSAPGDTPGSMVQVCFPSAQASVLDSLNRQREDGRLCDLSIHVQGQVFKAHRCVLAASSPYFHDQVLLKNMSTVSIPAVMDPLAFESVLSCAYTGQLRMLRDDIVNYLTDGEDSALPPQKRPTYSQPSIMPRKQWVVVKTERTEDDDLIVVSGEEGGEDEDDEDEREAELARERERSDFNISNVRSLSAELSSRAENDMDSQMDYCQSSEDYLKFEGGLMDQTLAQHLHDNAAGQSQSANRAVSALLGQVQSAASARAQLFPLDMQGNQILLYSQASGLSLDAAPLPWGWQGA
ncbi:hypothetical protein INR49_003441 [Caranx melampygus]|nr:hypothetical protein INR49_003441 [Caranx melampygus]